MSGVDLTTAASARDLGSIQLYACGLGIILYSRSLLPALRSEASSAERDRLYSNALTSGRAVRIATGSPQLYYHCSFSTRPASGDPRVRARTTFGLCLDGNGLGLCDGYAELDWADQGYQHEVVEIPSGYYSVDAAYLGEARDPKADMALFFQLTPQSVVAGPSRDFVELLFEQ